MILEKIDQEILYSLDEDSTKSLTKIGQELGISPQLVKYHVEKLEKDKLILAYWPMIEFRKLGNSNASYFLKLKNLSSAAERELYEYLKKINDFNIAMRGDGYWDLHLVISSSNIFRTVEVFNLFYDKFHHFIVSYETAIAVGFYQFRREYLNPRSAKQSPDPMAFTGADVEKFPLTNLQLKILEELNNNARQPISDLSKKLNVSRDKIIYNLKKINAERIIQSNATLLDHDRLGWPRYRVLLQVTNFTSEKFQEFFAYCQNHPNIIHLLRLFGNWQALIDVEIENREKLRELFQEIMNRFGDIILRIENTHVYKIDKFRDIPLKLSKQHPDE
ncbi:MAG: Lrp/AsnC family transcriptional regulator [Parcubacteria group bacterium]|jgi:DNA-binding Lrp family transcriptional regulator